MAWQRAQMGVVGGGGPTLLEWGGGKIVMARRVPREVLSTEMRRVLRRILNACKQPIRESAEIGFFSFRTSTI